MIYLKGLVCKHKTYGNSNHGRKTAKGRHGRYLYSRERKVVHYGSHDGGKNAKENEADDVINVKVRIEIMNNISADKVAHNVDCVEHNSTEKAGEICDLHRGEVG